MHSRSIFGGNTRQFGMIFALVALVCFFQIFTERPRLTPTNVINLFNGNSYILILAIGMVLVIIAGHIDLSVGSVAAFVGIVVAIAMRDWGIPWYAGRAARPGPRCRDRRLAGLLGCLRGNSRPSSSPWPACCCSAEPTSSWASPTPSRCRSDFRAMGAGFLPEIGPITGYNNLTLLLGFAAVAFVIFSEFRRRRTDARHRGRSPETWVPITRSSSCCAAPSSTPPTSSPPAAPDTSFPIPGLILAVLVLIYGFISTKTVLGRHVYAVGGNRHAAELSGVQSKKVNFLVMMNMSILAAWPA